MYKISKYNYFVPYRDKILYYNSLRSRSFAMTPAEHEKISKLFEDPVSFSLEYPSVFTQFHNWGFFTDSYANEEAVFRYLYNRNIVFNNDYHLVLVNTAKQEFSSAFTEAASKHINQALCSKEVKRICIEWRGYNVLNIFDSCIKPLFNRAKKMCAAAGIDLLGQIEVKMSEHLMVDNMLSHKKMIPAHERVLQAIQHIITKCPDYRIRLYIDAFPSDPAAKANFLNQLGDSALKRIHLIWDLHKKNETGDSENSIADLVKKSLSEDSEEVNPELSYPLFGPRKNLSVIYPDYQVYMTVPSDLTLKTQHAQGILNEADGIIQWNEPEREKLLSQIWFENEKCISCKHLPLLAHICPLLKIPTGLICPLENQMIYPETIIIKEFERKQQ